VVLTSAVAMLRKVMSPSGFTFTSGHHLPQGSTILGIPYAAESLNPTIYENPEEFDGYRFVKLKKESDDPNRWGFASINGGHWGNGKHACPGRFFAALEVKLLLAAILMKYDVRMADGQPRPKDGHFAVNVMANTEAVVEFRRKR
jgi:cytochrome P450